MTHAEITQDAAAERRLQVVARPCEVVAKTAGYEILQYKGIIARRAVVQDGQMDTECPDQRPKLDLPCAEAQQAAVAGIPTVDTNRVTQAVMSACINSISPEWPNHVRLAAICQETLAQSALAVKDGHPRIAAVLEEASRDATLHDAFAHSASSASALRLGDVATSRLIQADIQQLREEITELQSAQQEVIAQRTAIKQRQASVQKFGEAASTADAAPVHAQCTEDPSALPQAAVAGQDRDNNVRALQEKVIEALTQRVDLLKDQMQWNVCEYQENMKRKHSAEAAAAAAKLSKTST